MFSDCARRYSINYMFRYYDGRTDGRTGAIHRKTTNQTICDGGGPLYYIIPSLFNRPPLSPHSQSLLLHILYIYVFGSTMKVFKNPYTHTQSYNILFIHTHTNLGRADVVRARRSTMRRIVFFRKLSTQSYCGIIVFMCTYYCTYIYIRRPRLGARCVNNLSVPESGFDQCALCLKGRLPNKVSETRLIPASRCTSPARTRVPALLHYHYYYYVMFQYECT